MLLWWWWRTGREAGASATWVQHVAVVIANVRRCAERVPLRAWLRHSASASQRGCVADRASCCCRAGPAPARLQGITDWTYATAVVIDVAPVDSLEAWARRGVWLVPPSRLWVLFCTSLVDVLLSSALLVCVLKPLFSVSRFSRISLMMMSRALPFCQWISSACGRSCRALFFLPSCLSSSPLLECVAGLSVVPKELHLAFPPAPLMVAVVKVKLRWRRRPPSPNSRGSPSRMCAASGIRPPVASRVTAREMRAVPPATQQMQVFLGAAS